MQAAGEDSAETGVLPGTGSRSVLLEAADPVLAGRCAALLCQAGFHVSYCAGSGLQTGGCPLLTGGRCTLVDAAEVVVHALPGATGRAVLARLEAGDTPVLALTAPGGATQGSRDTLPADLGPGALAEQVRRLYASRAKRLRLPVQLRDGRLLWIRAIDGADAELLREFDGHLSEASRRFRYLGPAPSLRPEQAARLAAVGFRDRFALVAEAQQGDRRRLVADCRLEPMPETEGRSEVAIAVADEYQGMGLGRLLLGLVMGIAADRGLDEVVAVVHYDNGRMMHLLGELGFRRTGWEPGAVTFTARPDGRPEGRGGVLRG